MAIFVERIRNEPKENLVYVDESGIDTYLYREYARASRGKKIIERVSGRKFARQSIVAPKCGNEILAPFGYTGTCDAKLFNFWLKNMLIPKLKPGQIVIMDNASIHKTDTARRLIKEAGCELIFLPPYSPDLNPIERFLADLKKKLRYIVHQFKTFQNAMTAIFS